MQYNASKLVYYEIIDDPETAIKRKQLNKWRRQWKINIINEFNPEWKDLYEQIF